MQAAVFRGVGDLAVEQRPVPQPAAGEVLVQVMACGICGTDRHIFHGDFETRPPVVIGHEYAGRIAAVGPLVTELHVGDRVAVDPNIYCGKCGPCRRGQIHMCRNLVALGVDIDGGFAEYSLVPVSQCFALPESVTFLEGAMAEPLACCVHGMDLAGVRSGDTVAVIGAGAIGQIMAQLARLQGAGRVLVSDPSPARRELALSLGADEVIDPLQEDPTRPGGRLEQGAHVVIEAVGSAVTNAQAVEWAAPAATVLWFGVTPPEQRVSVSPNLVFQKELTIRGARINPYTHARALALLGSGRLTVTPLITQRATLDQLPGLLTTGPGDHPKTVILPNGPLES
ncbi:MAG: zinc-dependent alcohol dehydrogenase family protein [Anaerolineae bacterium]|nr:zinc-dependent alcohol dehydrogenase family protein [Chloroflexota bacterium]